MLKLDKNTLKYFNERNAEKIKVFFYGAGCSGTKVDVVDEFDIDESVEEVIPLLTSPQERSETTILKLKQSRGIAQGE